MRLATVPLAALSLAACTTIWFQAPRPLFAPEDRVDAKCETYASLKSLSEAVANHAREGWRVMQTGTKTTCFIFCSSDPIVCFEKLQGAAPPSTAAAVAPATPQTPPSAPEPTGRKCMSDGSCDTGEKCVFIGGGAFATGHCTPK